MNIIPFGNNILIEPIEKKNVLLSDQQLLCEYGLVVAVGGDVKHIKVGDKIGFTVWGVNKLQIDNETYHFVPEDSRFILGTIRMSGELASQVQNPPKFGNRSSGSL
jgi:co-chaperonin GroES (HSP10)